MKRISSVCRMLFCLALICLALSYPCRASDSEVVRDGSRSFLNLSGEWEVLPIEGLKFNFPPPTAGWEKAPVPSESTPALAAPGNPYGGSVPEYLNAGKTDFLHKTGTAVWFKRSFSLPELPPGQRALLRFQGMSFRSEVWLNGKKIGGSLFGQVPVTYDVTEAIHAGNSNELVVGLTSREGIIDLANQTFIAPASGSPAGIWGKVEVEIVPDARIDDVFIKTSVKNQLLSLDVTVLNSGKQPAQVTVGALVTDVKQTPEFTLPSAEITLAPGESKVVTLSKIWKTPNLWSPSNPALYFARVSLSQGTNNADTKTVRFGFREFEIRGRDFYLNGERIVLLRNSWLRSLPASRANIFPEARASAGNPINCVRMHIGFNSEAALDLCDELGLMALPESSWYSLGEKFLLDKRQLWIPNAQAYLKELIKLHRNRPSVVMWNLTNETVWGKTTPEHMEVADAMISAAKAADPTRPLEGDAEVNWDGRLPVINIHYPEASVGNSLRSKYPNASFVYPNDYYWLSQDQENTSWNAKFHWDRPLIIGEYFYPSGDTDKYSSFMGDSVYDWEKWRNQRMDGRDLGPLDENEFVNAQAGLTDAYRIQGVAGVNPWASDGKKAMPQVAVRPVDLFPNAFAGTTAVRKFAVFNDSGHDFNHLSLQCRLTVKGETVWEQTFPAYPSPGEPKIVEVPISCPATDAPVQAELSARLFFEIGGGSWQQIDRRVEPFFILPAPNLADAAGKSVFLLDKTGKTAHALQTLGLKVKASANVSSSDLGGVKTLVIGEDTDATPFKEAIVDFVKNGGAVIVLRQEQWTPLTPELPEIDKDHVSTRSWRRAFDHPITRDFDDRQLSYWRPDHVVSIKTFRKPSAGRYRILLDAGGLFGLRWTPLVEVPLGRGTFVLTSLDLVSRVKVEPAAAQLLANMIRYAGSYQPAKEAPLRLLAGKNPPLRAALTAAGVVFEEGLPGTGPILLDASDDLPKEQLDQVKSFLTSGGNVWLHGFSRETLSRVAALFPFTPELEKADPTVQSAVVRSEDPLLNNLASFDFFWTRIDLEARGDFFHKAHPTARLGDGVLKLPSLQSGARLIHPGLLTKVPSGKGALLFDTLAWDEALGSEADKVSRIVSALAANQGAEVRTATDEIPYDCFPVDLSKQANMGYYDRTANDGKGGWTDQGRNDMRFFLINHLGKTGGLETGAEVEVQQFPAEVTLAGRKFWLLDPRKTSDHAVVSLRGGDHGKQLPGEAKGIPVGRKADTLWFLNAAGWAPADPDQEVARYSIHYADGSEAVFPIRYGQEISEWWNPRPLTKAKVAWTGNNLETSPIGIYSTEWKNPQPEKEIATIDLIGNLSPVQVVVLAITGGVAGGPAGERLSEWNLREFGGKTISNQVSGGGVLAVNPSGPPVIPGADGAHFSSGASLRVDSGALPKGGGFGKANQPFSVQVTFSPSAAPAGYYGGLFQAAAYGSSGFRLLLNRQMKLVVEIFGVGNRGLESSIPLEKGRFYTAEVRFDGSYASLLIDGKVDAMKEMPLPPPFNGDVMVGNAAGTNYGFEGTISALKLNALPR